MSLDVTTLIAMGTFLLAVAGISAGAAWAIHNSLIKFRDHISSRLEDMRKEFADSHRDLDRDLNDATDNLHSRLSAAQDRLTVVESRVSAIEARCSIHHNLKGDSGA